MIPQRVQQRGPRRDPEVGFDAVDNKRYRDLIGEGNGIAALSRACCTIQISAPLRVHPQVPSGICLKRGASSAVPHYRRSNLRQPGVSPIPRKPCAALEMSRIWVTVQRRQITYAQSVISGGRHGRRQQQPDRVASGSDQEAPRGAEQIETARHNFGEIAGSKTIGQCQKAVDELKRKVWESERIIAAYQKQTRRPLPTDFPNSRQRPLEQVECLKLVGPAIAQTPGSRTLPVIPGRCEASIPDVQLHIGESLGFPGAQLRT